MTKIKFTKNQIKLMKAQLTFWKDESPKKERKVFKTILKKLKK